MLENNFEFSKKEQLFPGVWVYRDVFKKEFNLENRLEQEIKNSNNKYQWNEATVGYNQSVKSYRDCVDFKLKKRDLPDKDQHMLIFDEIWQDIYDAQLPAVNDYCRMYSIQMNYWEATNFIRYGEGQHFQEHSDHGNSYSATVSLVGYPNNNYEGGELFFNKLNLSIKPKLGDLYIFPSTYLFSHTAMPVQSGLKYSIVTMLDYNNYTHIPEFRDLVDKQLNQKINW